LRSSVSRAVKTLQDGHLITRRGRTLILTDAGHGEVLRLTMIPSKKRDLAERTLEQAMQQQMRLESFMNSPTIRALESFMNSPTARALESFANHNTSILRAAEAFQNIPALPPAEVFQYIPMLRVSGAFQNIPALPPAEVFQNLPNLQVSGSLMNAINATAQIQSINLQWLKSWHHENSYPLSHLLVGNNAFLSSIIIDLEAIALINPVPDGIQNLINQTSKVANAYSAYFKDVALKFNQIPNAENLELALIIPTTATASLVSSARSIIESQIVSQIDEKLNPSEPTRVRVFSEQYTAITTILQGYLKPLGERFVNKWEGAWQTLCSESKDRYSQTTHSGRELLMQVLEYLSPDSVFKEKNPTRKMRVRYILSSSGKSTVDLIDSMADLLDDMYHMLAGEAHRRDGKHDYDVTVAGQLITLGGALITLLSQQSATHLG
jgi:hypothetical protein